MKHTGAHATGNAKLALIIIISALSMCLVPSSRLVKATDTTPRFYPSPRSPVVNSTLSFDLDIGIEYIYKMTAYQVFISWDPTLLAVTNVKKGVFLSNGSRYQTLEKKNLNNAAGLLKYTEYQTLPQYETGVGGNGTLFTMTFAVNGTGQCTVHLYNTILTYVTSELTNVADDGYFNNRLITYSYAGVEYSIAMESNSTAHDLGFNLTSKSLVLNVSGASGTAGYVNITIPKSLMDVDLGKPPGAWAVILDGVPTTAFTSTSNSTHTFVHLTYTHSDHSILVQGNEVIPELTQNTYLLLLLLTATAMLTLLVRRKKLELTKKVD